MVTAPPPAKPPTRSTAIGCAASVGRSASRSSTRVRQSGRRRFMLTSSRRWQRRPSRPRARRWRSRCGSYCWQTSPARRPSTSGLGTASWCRIHRPALPRAHRRVRTRLRSGPRCACSLPTRRRVPSCSRCSRRTRAARTWRCPYGRKTLSSACAAVPRTTPPARRTQTARAPAPRAAATPHPAEAQCCHRRRAPPPPRRAIPATRARPPRTGTMWA
mmetsp:Transcript_32027/g.76269  ORF Transcript_32027/g.76269 Transcript_32027/m.76269 type:complete len:217 (+) Transcript_32027:139-789(+)